MEKIHFISYGDEKYKIAKKHGTIIITHESWYNNFNDEYVKKIPFLATRKQN